MSGVLVDVPKPLDDVEARALATLERFFGTTSVPKYVRDGVGPLVARLQERAS